MANVTRTMNAVKVTMPDNTSKIMTKSSAVAVKNLIPGVKVENIKGVFMCSEDEFLSVATLK